MRGRIGRQSGKVNIDLAFQGSGDRPGTCTELLDCNTLLLNHDLCALSNQTIKSSNDALTARIRKTSDESHRNLISQDRCSIALSTKHSGGRRHNNREARRSLPKAHACNGPAPPKATSEKSRGS